MAHLVAASFSTQCLLEVPREGWPIQTHSARFPIFRRCGAAVRGSRGIPPRLVQRWKIRTLPPFIGERTGSGLQRGEGEKTRERKDERGKSWKVSGTRHT